MYTQGDKYTAVLPFVGQNPAMAKHPSDLSNTVAIFAAKLRKLIDFYGESDVAAGRRCRIKQQQIGRLKKGLQAPNLDTVHRVAEGYNVQPYQLLLSSFNPADLPHAITTRLWHRIQRNIAEAKDIALDEPETPDSGPAGADNHSSRPGSSKGDGAAHSKGSKKAVPRPRH